MAAGGRGIVVPIDERALEALVLAPGGELYAYMGRVAEAVTQEAKRLAPVGDADSKAGHPSGYLRSQIGWDHGKDGRGPYWDIASPALTSSANPFPGEPYGLYNEVPSRRPRNAPDWVKAKEGPYLRPALQAARGVR